MWLSVVESGGKEVHLRLVSQGTLPGRRDHSVWMAWPSLDSLTAIIFSQLVMYQTLRVTCFLEHQVRILHRRAHRGTDFIPLTCLYRQSLWCLSVAMSTMLFTQKSCNSFSARKSAFSSRSFMCNLLSGRKQVPLALSLFKREPHPPFNVSVRFEEHALVGVMVGFVAHCFPPATILDGGGETWG